MVLLLFAPPRGDCEDDPAAKWQTDGLDAAADKADRFLLAVTVAWPPSGHANRGGWVM